MQLQERGINYQIYFFDRIGIFIGYMYFFTTTPFVASWFSNRRTTILVKWTQKKKSPGTEKYMENKFC